ncbi:uncharacterized protein [Physcomitrium patens]|uniref:Myb-like domain-containing protein n=2 Tax=Physcomitrium patens TaxID=3218 RepID=A9TT52_PHYPA|nr:uncharacterized protein LOC112284927 isoform X2 [Physcomitrium patens]|eukprot:XP_024381085.1 uncharacterized protein LOC112284927 isoform X2 [Physcomitrella patens]
MGAPPSVSIKSEGSEGTAMTGSKGTEGGERTHGLQLLLHDTGLDLEWSPSEQSILNENLVKFANESSSMSKYVKIAALLPDKTVRDVALRCHWLSKNEDAKRKSEELAAKSHNDQKAFYKQGHSAVPMYTAPLPPMETDDGISFEAIGGTTGKLLEVNSQAILKIRANLAASQAQENTDLLVQVRDNIYAILNGMMSMPGIMSQMPPLPVKLNSELADSILPQPTPQPSAA